MLTTHLQQEVSCNRCELEELEGCRKEQEACLHSRKRLRGMKEADQWKDVYRILFPGVFDSDIPSPCKQAVLPYISLNQH